jgi:hypothetical protein
MEPLHWISDGPFRRKIVEKVKTFSERLLIPSGIGDQKVKTPFIGRLLVLRDR